MSSFKTENTFLLILSATIGTFFAIGIVTSIFGQLPGQAKVVVFSKDWFSKISSFEQRVMENRSTVYNKMYFIPKVLIKYKGVDLCLAKNKFKAKFVILLN
jgi:hypothetical protein